MESQSCPVVLTAHEQGYAPASASDSLGGTFDGAVLASLIYNFILFPDTKTLAQRLAILTGSAEMEKMEGEQPQKRESQSNSEDTEMETACGGKYRAWPPPSSL